MKIEPVGTPLLIKAQPIEQKTDRVVTKKAAPLSSLKADKKVAVINTDKKCYHKGFKDTDMANSIIQYACEVSNYDVNFILTLNSENGARDYKKQSNVVKNGVREPSYGVCQMHYRYHKKDVYENLPYNRIFESKYLTDWKYQVEVCWNKYKGGTTFYGYKYRRKNAVGNIFIGGQQF